MVVLHVKYAMFTDLHVTLDGTATRHVLIVGASEAKPLSSGWCKPEDLVGISWKLWCVVSTPYAVGWLVGSLDGWNNAYT